MKKITLLVLVLVTGFFLGGCQLTNPKMANDDIVKEVKKCEEAGMTYYQTNNMDSEVTGVYCVKKQ